VLNGLLNVSVFLCFIVFNCSIYVVIFSIFLGADASALVPFCPAQFNVTHCRCIRMIIFEPINDDDEMGQEPLTDYL